MVTPSTRWLRGSVRFINTKIPVLPRTTFNLGQVEGGTSVNSIPHEAKTESGSAIRERRRTGAAGIGAARLHRHRREGRDGQRARTAAKGKLDWKVEMIGSRPGGELTADSALLASLRAADDYLGNQSRIERSSTDANIPLSLGIEAIAIGAGGNGGGAHSFAGMV